MVVGGGGGIGREGDIERLYRLFFEKKLGKVRYYIEGREERDILTYLPSCFSFLVIEHTYTHN